MNFSRKTKFSEGCKIKFGILLNPHCGREVVRVFEKFGWRFVRQSSSHIVMVKEGEIVTLSIPDHREVAKETLRSLIRTAGLTVQEFVSAI